MEEYVYGCLAGNCEKKEITGKELLGETEFARLVAADIRIKPNRENATFAYVNTKS